MWRERFCYYVLHRRARRSLVNPCGRGVNAFALMLSKNSVVQCVSNLLRGSSTFFFSATFRHTDEESLIDIFCNLIALGFTRIRSGSLGFDRSLERERDTRDTKNFRYKNTVVNTVFIPRSIFILLLANIYTRVPTTGTLLGIIWHRNNTS